MVKVLIAGTFDVIHPGHLNLIQQARALGDSLVIVLARDINVFKTKGFQPYYAESQRLAHLRSLLNDKWPNVTIVLGGAADPYKIIRTEKPEIVALGYDQQAFVGGLSDIKLNSSLSFKIERLEPFHKDVCKGKNIKKALLDASAGFLLVDKDVDWTSHDVVAKLRSITGLRQIGHAGTLDPFATGLLICALGQATKMIDLFHLLPKEYAAEIRLGVESDTYDRTGKIFKSKFPISHKIQIPHDQIKKILALFIGKQQQLPPMYSAKKVAGKKLYQLARLGKVVERKASEIMIYDLSLKDDYHQSPIINLQVKCSAGTYIRTLAHDLGQSLGTGALVEELKRTAIGDFKVEQAVGLDRLHHDNYRQFCLPPATALASINSAYLESLTTAYSRPLL